MTDAPFGKSPDGSANPRAVSVRVKSAPATTIGGQNAHDLRKGAQPSYVDSDRSYLNRVLIDPLTGSQLREIALDRRSVRSTARALKSNAAVGYVGIVTFGHVAQTYWAELTHEEQDRALWTVTDRIATRLNTTVTGLVLHRDEEAEHAHFQMPGFDLDGQPLSQTARRQALRDLQTLAAEVMQQFDPRFERGFSKEARKEAGAAPEDLKNKTVAQLHQTQAADLEKARATLAALDEKAAKNQALIEKAEAKIQAGRGDLEKLVRNIETYTRRRDAARFEAQQEEARLSAARVRSKQRQDEEAAKTRAAEEATAAAQDREKAAALAAQKEERRRDELTRANQEAAAELAAQKAETKAQDRAQEVLDYTMTLAARDPAALFEPAEPFDPEDHPAWPVNQIEQVLASVGRVIEGHSSIYQLRTAQPICTIEPFGGIL